MIEFKVKYEDLDDLPGEFILNYSIRFLINHSKVKICPTYVLTCDEYVNYKVMTSSRTIVINSLSQQ